jgi:hypothetical protein
VKGPVTLGCVVRLAAVERLVHRFGLSDQGVGIVGIGDLLAALRLDLGDERGELVAGPGAVVGVEVLLRVGELLQQAVLGSARQVEAFDRSDRRSSSASQP